MVDDGYAVVIVDFYYVAAGLWWFVAELEVAVFFDYGAAVDHSGGARSAEFYCVGEAVWFDDVGDFFCVFFESAGEANI